ncbi:MAG: hypothetical protein ACFE8A_02505 [Candidatus Hodarchaeota archaeon]
MLRKFAKVLKKANSRVPDRRGSNTLGNKRMICRYCFNHTFNIIIGNSEKQ